jgi:hypothetical protein
MSKISFVEKIKIQDSRDKNNFFMHPSFWSLANLGIKSLKKIQEKFNLTHFQLNFTMATYDIGFGCVWCCWKANKLRI